MLSLLKPWRGLADLKAPDTSWASAFEAFSQTTSRRNRDILSGIQYYYDCRSAAESESEKSPEGPDSIEFQGQDWVTHEAQDEGVDGRGGTSSDEVRVITHTPIYF
jgi:hypothetical protein